MDYMLTELDKFVTRTLSEWDRLSTTLFILLISSFVYFVIYTREPDTHPIFLARQSQASSVRQKGESAIFRNHAAPHGIALNSGLNIKNPGDAKWTNGRDGDLRDIWLKAISGHQNRQGNESGHYGKIFTIHGTKEIIEHNLDNVTKQIKLIGEHMKKNQGKRVAIYLPNSMEFLAALFACAFHEMTAILLQYDQPLENIISQIEKSEADSVVAAAGSFPLEEFLKDTSALKQLIFVVDQGSQHLDWKEVPVGSRDSIDVSTWHEIVLNQELSTAVNLSLSERLDESKIVVFAAGEMVEISHANIIAGIAGQLTSLPATQAFTPSDLFVPIDCLSNIYPLTLTLSALFSNASVALTAVASHSPSLILATRGIAPTVIAASSDTIMKFHEETKEQLSSFLYSLVHWLETRSLTQNGILPMSSLLSSYFDKFRPEIGNSPGKLRLIFISSLVGVDKPISSLTLNDLRIYCKSRIIYALTASRVAGAVAQTLIFDYRVDEKPGKSHFGAPVTSVELYFRDKYPYKTTDKLSSGEIIVAGPAVVGGKVPLGVAGQMNDDLTLSLV